MMAGTGVGGAAMLRTRRRDVSVKPNRKLDRKSSRGMIYENEELRLRTIHINAEVEQGQNDIKKLRRENEQLRREIWSLRDEYDKLEEILKRQKSHEDSEEYEDRSEEDDGLQSDYSFEEEPDEEEEEELEESAQDSGKETSSRPEQLDNAENQKLSTEKMAGSSQHRLHVDFDDLSVVDEEEEPKKDKEKRENPSGGGRQAKDEKSPPSILKSRPSRENVQYYPAPYQPPTCLSSPTYYTDSPFKFPSTLNLMLPADTPAAMAAPCPSLNPDPLIPPGLAGLNMDLVSDRILHAPPAGWQSSILMPQKQFSAFPASELDGPGVQPFTGIRQDQPTQQQQYGSALGGFANFPSFIQRRSTGPRQGVNPFDSTMHGNSVEPGDEAAMGNGWLVDASPTTRRSPHDEQGSTDPVESRGTMDGSPALSGSEKLKHFFAPLPSKLKKPSEESPSATSHCGTGYSSSSDRTGSTVICRSQFPGQKGSADVYVNGAVPSEEHFPRGKADQRTFLSTENLFVAEEKSGGGNPLTKSMSCQDLPSESQPASIDHGHARQQLMTQSDNTLDLKPDLRPYKSHLSVTLKTPRAKQTVAPDTPEIPKLPSIDYRLFRNPFLRPFDSANSYTDRDNVTRPLSVQVNDDTLCYYPSQPEMPSLNRGHPFADRYKAGQTDQSRLLIPSDQLNNGKPMSPIGKHQIQVTSFERPSPHTLVGPSSPYDPNTLRRLNATPYLAGQTLYRNVPFLPGAGIYPQRGLMYYENPTMKVPAQTQTSIDGDSQHEDAFSHEESAPTTPSGQRRKKTTRKEKGNAAAREQKPLSPAAQRRLKKQSSVTSSEVPESPVKGPRKKSRRVSVTTTTTSEGQEDKNESRSSSSGQDSPKKDQMRRVSLYFNAKKRPSLASVKTVRSGSLDAAREKDATMMMMMNSERERTNSVSSRETGSAKARKASTSSGNVPWCACWGNGCI